MKGKQLIALDKDTQQELEFVVESDSYKHGGLEMKVSLEEKSDGFTILTLNGIEYPVDVLVEHQNHYEILVNGITYSFSIETPFSLTRKKMLSARSNESSVILLKAPMPGKILEVLVKAGDVVNSGDTLVVLEAMKMQNAILASSRATIKKVIARAGDTTSKSDLLIELERI